MRFRPCIDLHAGRVKQIVGGTLTGTPCAGPVTNFISDRSPAYYARLYRQDGLSGGHVIMLGPGNEEAAGEALAAWPGGLQVGGGITSDNARVWLDRGASAIIVTSFVFRDGVVDEGRLAALEALVGKDRLVLDLSCRRRDGEYFIVTDRWQKFTATAITPKSLNELSLHCSEFLIHAADVEGLCRGVEEELVELLGQFSPIPTTYAGGVKDIADVGRVNELGRGRLDITVGSALDLFGGTGVRYSDLVATMRAGQGT